MKQKFRLSLAIACFSLVTSEGCAQKSSVDPGSQVPHSQASSSTEKNQKRGGMMGGSMNMSHMQGMMEECMKNHKDGKVCHEQTMEHCKSQMNPRDCQKMMMKMNSGKK